MTVPVRHSYVIFMTVPSCQLGSGFLYIYLVYVFDAFVWNYSHFVRNYSHFVLSSIISGVMLQLLWIKIYWECSNNKRLSCCSDKSNVWSNHVPVKIKIYVDIISLFTAIMLKALSGQLLYNEPFPVLSLHEDDCTFLSKNLNIALFIYLIFCLKYTWIHTLWVIFRQIKLCPTFSALLTMKYM